MKYDNENILKIQRSLQEAASSVPEYSLPNWTISKDFGSEENQNALCVLDAEGIIIARIEPLCLGWSKQLPTEALANAQLIAKAPATLSALERLCAVIQAGQCPAGPTYLDALRAISDAKSF